MVVSCIVGECRRYFLGLLQLDEGLDAEAYDTAINITLSPFMNIKNVFSVTLDNCSAMLKLGRIISVQNHVNCAIHAFQSCVEALMKLDSISSLFERVKAVISELNSHYNRKALQHQQTTMGEARRGSFLPNATRWDSEYNS